MNPLVRQIKSTFLALPWLMGLMDSYLRRRASFDRSGVSTLFTDAFRRYHLLIVSEKRD